MNKIRVYTICSLATIVLVVSSFYVVNSNSKKTETVTITYNVLEETVKTETIIKGSKIKSIYTYESKNHQTYVSMWEYGDNTLEESTVINEDITVVGTPETSLKLFTTDENEYTYINGVNHVHSDGKVVVLPTYRNKEINIGVGCFYNNEGIKEIYLPSTIHHIFDNNFVNCSNLITIYYSGDKNSWEAIPTSSVVPNNVNVVYNTTFNID